MTEHKFAIIGAGFGGLGIAVAFQRHAIPFDIFEADDDLGGNWYHGVYETVHIISSRKTTEYSDFPMPASYPDFPSARQMLDYLRAYADHYDLRPHIAFNTRVEHVAPAPGERWLVTLANGEQRIYKGVVIAIGHHWDCRLPDYPGRFDGQLIHSKQYRTHDILDGKRVLVIGGGNSACDIAVEAARFAAESHISLRRGYWFLPKTLFGRPSVELMQPWMPVSVQRLVMRGLLRVVVGPYEEYGLPAPDHRLFDHHPTVNSELLYYLKHGRIMPHPDIHHFDGEFVEFVDGVRRPFDLIVAATGFHLSVPFLEPGIIDIRDDVPQLIDGLFSPRYKHIYLFGSQQPRYGAGPLVSAGAETLAQFVLAQDQMTRPVGAVLARLGRKPPASMITDPFKALRGARLGQKVAPQLPRLERLLFRG